jgi:hypothetical protein
MMRRFRGERRVGDEAERADPILDHHEHDTLARETFSVACALSSPTAVVAAAVDPHHHRLPRVAAEVRRPDVEIEAVLAGGERSLRRRMSAEAGREAGVELG